ncbi:restriction endonuclease subunit S [Thauera phenolivorans]|uniref:restriction endonuclease subunit S n=1 Tax=Thauera phenolivorans TaxID=1792543 RepID=UPI001E33F7BF|nr:restriction endonuclease subunit S [Thauera phenolivorans]
MGEIFGHDRIGCISMERVQLSHAEIERFSVRPLDLMFARQSMVAEGAGKCSLVTAVDEVTCFESHLIRVRLDQREADPEFFYLYFKSRLGRSKIEAIVTGAAQKGIRGSELQELTVDCPPLESQRRIASILSAYDDLIENNTRRIAILEEMARRIYEEWFVRFRFPGYEPVKMVESELGLIPEGWRVQTVAQTFQILGGGTPSKAEPTYWEGGTINWYSPTDLTRAGTSFMEQSADRITALGLAKSSAKLFPPMSVMLTSRATIGVVAVNTNEACTNQGFITCLPNSDYPLWFLYHWLKANVETFIGLGTGATFKEITKGTFKGIRLLVPPQDLVGAFSSTAEQLMLLSLNLQRKNRNLRATRDLLLPKLISGELDVSTLPEPEAA